MADSSTFKDKQYAFAAHIRDPDAVPAPEDIEARRMAVYRRLFFNNLDSLLGKFFPVLRKIHTDRQWHRFIRGFLQHHKAQTPYFLQLPQEFLAYLQTEFTPGEDDYPFLLELAHYEYAELALSVADAANDQRQVDPHGDLLEGVPARSPFVWVFAYRYPVHRISPDFLPGEPGDQPTYLALYRNADDDVGFLELNAVTAALLEQIDNNDTLNGAALLGQLAERFGYPDAEAFLQHGADALREMRQLEILAGTLKSS